MTLVDTQILAKGSNNATYCCVPVKASKQGTTMNSTLAKNSPVRNVCGNIILNRKVLLLQHPGSSLEPQLICGSWTPAFFRVCLNLRLAYKECEGTLPPMGYLSCFCVAWTSPLESSVVLSASWGCRMPQIREGWLLRLTSLGVGLGYWCD